MKAQILYPTEIQPSPEKLRSILQVALRAPSGDNCQPWRLGWDGKRLHIYHDETRAKHALNRDNHASFLALGCLLESIAIQASVEGFSIATDETTRRSPFTRVTFHASHETPDVLAKEIPKRFTDRRPFRPSSLNQEALQAFAEQTEIFPSVRVRVRPTVPREFLNFLSDCEEIVWRLQRYHRDLFEWIRFDDSQVQSTRDGMPWDTLGVSFLESRMLRLCSNFQVQRVLNQLGFLLNVRQMLRRQVTSSAALYCITVESAEPEDLVKAGRSAMRAWLWLSQKDFGVQPLTLGSLSVYDFFRGAVPAETPTRFKTLFEGGRELYRKTFGLSRQEIPVWLFRTGLSRGRQGATLRLELDRILDFWDETPPASLNHPYR